MTTPRANKELGQYFTDPSIADFMASLLQHTLHREMLRIIDPGAGLGILTTSAALHYLSLGYKYIHAELYEIDKSLLAQLESNMVLLADTFSRHEGLFTFTIQHKDFLLERPDKTGSMFDVASINPPYFRYNSKTSPYAGATKDLFKGDPNIYASFMAVVASCLAPNGQMVAIVPRSFANGLYFKGFRKYINSLLSLEHIHIFRSRNQVFRDAAVLQENIICAYRKANQKSSITVTSSTGFEDLNIAECRTFATSQLVDKSTEHEILRIPETDEEAKILTQVENWPSSFNANGYFISTGPVVEHRTRQFIVSSEQQTNTVPLLRMHNVRPFLTEWTGTHKKDARFLLRDDYKKHVSPNKPYVILKRFSSKDEKRRLVAGVHDPAISSTSLIAMENHLNYIGHEGQLDLCEAYGLAVLFNSSLMDKYFRCISGNTQVNATEIRLLKLPSRNRIRRIGELFLKSGKNETLVDSLTEGTLAGGESDG